MIPVAGEYRGGGGWSQSPIPTDDFPLQLAGRPARVTHEDPQPLHRLLALKQSQEQRGVRAQVHAGTRGDGVRGALGSADQKPHRIEGHGAAEVKVCGPVREVFEAGK